MKDTWALLPLKRLDRAKRRLAPILGAGQRRALTLAMARDVLSALNEARIPDRTLLVTNEPEAGNLLRDRNLEVFYSACQEGLNREVEQAARFAGAHGARRILVVHADLPYLTADTLDRVAEDTPAKAVCVAARRRGSGVNLLLMPLPMSLKPVFGRDALASIRRQAQKRKTELMAVREEQLEKDIDLPEDFAWLVESAKGGQPPGPATHAFLEWLARSGGEGQAHYADIPDGIHPVRPIAGRGK